jgi:hypothetical protein
MEIKMVVVEMYLVVFNLLVFITPAVLWVLFFEIGMLDRSQFPYVRNSSLQYTFYLKCMILIYLMRQLKVEPFKDFFHCSNRYIVYIPLLLQVHSRECGSARGSVQATASQVHATSYSTRTHCTSF